MKNMIRAIALFSFLASPVIAGGMFHSISYEEALELSAQENKPVFIDFYTDWCGPCKMVNQTVFKDKKAVEYFKKNTIAIKINAEKNTKVSNQFKISAYPTFVVVNSKGHELGRFSGAILVPRLFIEQVEGLISGKDAFTLAKEQLEEQGGKANFDAMLDYSRKTIDLYEYKEATQSLAWCYEQATTPGTLHSDSLYRLTAIFKDLTKRYADPKDTYENLMKKAETDFIRLEKEMKKAKDPKAIEGLEEKFSLAAKAHLGFLAAEGESAAGIDLFESYRKNNKDVLARSIFSVVFPILLEQKEYTIIQDYIDIPQAAKQRIEQCKQQIDALPRDKKKEMKVTYQTEAVDVVSGYYQALLALDRGKEARKVASSLSRLYRSAYTYNALAWKGYLSGKPDKTTLQQAEKAYKLANKDDIYIFDTLVRVTAAVKGKEDACECLRKDYRKYMGKGNASTTIRRLGMEYGCD